MAKFFFDETVPLNTWAVDSAALGTSVAKLGQADIGKLVKLSSADNYVLVADGNDIEAQIVAVAPHTVNNGVNFGSVQSRFKHLKVRNADAGALVVGDTVVAAAQPAAGTALTSAPPVKKGAGAVFVWRVKGLCGGTGAVGTDVIIEPITR